MRIQVIGAGGWGLALARHLAVNGHEVSIWCREEDGPDALRATRENPALLPGVLLPPSVEVTGEVDRNVEIVVLAVPSHAMRAVAARHPLPHDTIRVSVAKGIENETLLRMSEVITVCQAATNCGLVSGPCPIVALSGPSHAEEVGRGLPASIVAASADEDAAAVVRDAFMSSTLRVYTCPDIIGVELGGSLKNVVAIAAGVCDGLGLGDNAKAALVTRGLAEMARLGVAMGADPLTFAGLSGLGDLVVTCMSRHSRNRAVGERIARGERLDQITGGSKMVAEGVRTSRSAHELALRHEVDMPITHQVFRVLFEGADPRAAVTALMTRQAKPEQG
jgi:glycerol-3-phosphate dehydrogenase (NAD(P)+)